MFQFLWIFLGIEATDRNAPGVGSPQAFEDFYGGGFSGAVGAQETKYFAFLNVETDASHGFNFAVALDEILNLQNRIIHLQEL